MKDLDDKKVGQNKVLSSSLEVKMPLSTIIHAPRRGERWGDRSLATRRLLAFRTTLTRIPLCRFFLVTTFGALLACLVGRSCFRFAGS